MESKFARQSTIKDIKNDDFRLQIVGYVKNIVGDDEITLDDKTGEITVHIKDIEFNFELEDMVKVLGDFVISPSGEKSIQAQLITGMNNLNFSYYQKLYELKKEILNK